MTARDDILASVRAALSGTHGTQQPVPRGYRDSPTANDVVDLFVERVADYRATVTRCGPDTVEERIAEALGASSRVVVPYELAYRVPDAVADTDLGAADLDRIDAIVTTASVGIATTGTVVLDHGPGQGRRALSLIPDLHVCIVRAGDIVLGVPQAVSRLDPARPQTWISGPSATSDIELNRVEGVHGPRSLHVIVVDG